MIAFFFPNRPELVAFYGVASLLAGVVKKVRLAFDNSLAPELAAIIEKGDAALLQHHYETTGRWILTWYVLVLGPLSLGAPALLLVFGNDFSIYWYVVPILTLGRFMNAAAGPAQTALLMSGRSKLELVNNVAINLLNIGLNAYLIPRYQVAGAAVATAVSLLLFSLIRAAEVAVLLRVRVNISSASRLLLSGALAAVPAVPVVLANSFSTLTGIVLAAAYLVSFPVYLYLLGERRDIEHAVRALKRYLNKQQRALQWNERIK
jgi:O-antigen/teichoic acid export membrane protein